CPQDSEECREPGAGVVPTLDGPAEPGVPDGEEQEEPDVAAEPESCPDTPKPEPPTEEGSCTSSEDDTEGLRRRQGHEPRSVPPPPAPALHQGAPGTGDEDGLIMSKYLLGALALVALGLLIVSGEGPGWGSGPSSGPRPRRPLTLLHPQDSQQKPPASDTRDPRSLLSVSLLLDKLAKENQEIRLMQAELQAHKEELQTLLQKSEGEVAAAGAQQQSLAKENARLRAELDREATELRDALAELQGLRAAGAPGSPGAGEPAAEQPPSTGGARQQGRLHSLRQELAG
ncbi:PBIP1 protein, partial [Brachypteracias leptosomus]|nr:PBIP1 protein [Brachypteracias leptosomus]